MIRRSLLALALLLFATPMFAQGGPDASLSSQAKDEPGRTHARASERALPTPGEAARAQGAGEGGGRADADCERLGGGEATEAAAAPGGPRPDVRADRARCRKLTDADIATAPIAELRRSSRHVGRVAGRPFPYLATAGTLTIRDDEGK